MESASVHCLRHLRTTYNDAAKQQGTLLIMLVEQDQVGQATDGQLWLGHVLSMQDACYEFWQETLNAHSLV